MSKEIDAIIDKLRREKAERLSRSVEDYQASWGVSSTDGPTCPHCGKQVTPDEAFYYDENRYVDDTCDACGKAFRVELHVQHTWTTFRELEGEQ
jgi:hypothetical protein